MFFHLLAAAAAADKTSAATLGREEVRRFSVKFGFENTLATEAEQKRIGSDSRSGAGWRGERGWGWNLVDGDGERRCGNGEEM